MLFSTSVLLLAAAACTIPGTFSYSLSSCHHNHRQSTIRIPTTIGRKRIDDDTATPSSRLKMALGNNYLESFGRRRKEDDNENDNEFYAENNNSGGGFANSWNPGGGGTTRTAVRPPSSLTSRNNGNFNNNNNNGGGGIVPLVVSINQPQDLLDFVIRDERLSVGEYY